MVYESVGTSSRCTPRFSGKVKAQNLPVAGVHQECLVDIAHRDQQYRRGDYRSIG